MGLNIKTIPAGLIFAVIFFCNIVCALKIYHQHSVSVWHSFPSNGFKGEGTVGIALH